MLLQRLNEYADRLSLPPRLYSQAPVRYVIELDGRGRLLSKEPIDTANPADPSTRRGVPRLVPQVQRSSAIKPLLLADNAEYTLGLGRETSRPARVAACHHAYLELVERCAAVTRSPAVEAVASFLRADPLAQLRLPEAFDPGAAITFRVDGTLPVDLPEVQAFWAAEHDPATATEGPAKVMQCLVCGRQQPVLERLQTKLKGVPGGQTAGTALISANASAFESYGLHASQIAPTCASCGERLTKAANALLKDQASRVVVGKAVLICWVRRPLAGFSVVGLFTDPQPEQVRELVESVRTGRVVPEVDETAFYATVLSASGGRAVVREWIDTTVGQVKSSLATWFEQQRIIGAFGDQPRPLGVYALAAATARDPRVDLAPSTPRALLRAALTRTPLPPDLLYQAVRRNQAEQRVTRARAALIKLALLSNRPQAREGEMVELDPENVNPAYRCGRLLAVLEEIQRLAVPKASATIVDRFFGTASSAPASVFGRLMRGAQPHLAKLERDRPGAYHALQRRLEEVLAGLQSFPSVLTLEEQGLFALGYYHQRAHDRAMAREASERRRAGTAPGEEELASAFAPDLAE